MESGYSYADPIVGVVFMHIAGEAAERHGLIPDRALTRDERLALAERAEEVALTSGMSLFLHEWAHLLQVAAYPTLYRRAAVHARPMGAYWGFLKANPRRWPLPLDDQIMVAPDYESRRLFETVAVRLDIGDSALEMKPVDSVLRRGTVTEIDMVEEDASIFQYRTEIGSRGNGRGYRRWLAEGPRYSRVFSILTQHMTDDQAYQLLPILVRVAFTTTFPLKGFASILGTILYHGAGTFEGTDDATLDAMLLDELRDRYGSAGEDWADFRTPEPDEPLVIEREARLLLIENTPHLPLRWHARWSLEHASGDFLRSALAAPWTHVGRMGRTLGDELRRFTPPAIVTVVDHPDYPPAARTLRVADALLDAKVDEVDGIAASHLVAETLRARLLMDVRAGIRKPLRRCPHDRCPYHATKLCDGWLSIPVEPADCIFPEYLSTVSGHTLDPGGKVLVPLTPTEDDG